MVPVFVLCANWGSIRSLRKTVPHIVKAIVLAKRARPLERKTYLKQEMREHYRLREIGAIDGDACDLGTRNVLQAFG